jgi:hypothetical protein
VPPSLTKWRYTSDYEQRKRRHVSSPNSQNDPKGPAWPSPCRLDPTPTQPNPNDAMRTPAIGVGPRACYTGTKARIVASPTNIVTNWPWGNARSPTTITGITYSSTTPTPAPTGEITKESSLAASMPRRNRLKYGNGPNVFGRDGPVWRLGHWSDEIGTVGSVTKAEMEWHTGSGVPFNKDSRLNFQSWIGSRP